MEFLKKNITTNPLSGTSYSFNILLTQSSRNLGLYISDDEGESPLFEEVFEYTVTGTSSSRINEIEKYTVTNDISKKYFLSNDISTNGLDLTRSITGDTANTQLVYYIDGIEFKDIMSSGITTTEFSVDQIFYDSNVYQNVVVYYDDTYRKVVNPIKIQRDVFIDRQRQSVFDKNTRLSVANRLSDLQTYAGGTYFNIKENI